MPCVSHLPTVTHSAHPCTTTTILAPLTQLEPSTRCRFPAIRSERSPNVNPRSKLPLRSTSGSGPSLRLARGGRLDSSAVTADTRCMLDEPAPSLARLLAGHAHATVSLLRQDRPQSSRTSPESAAVLELANRLALAGREDLGAVSELRTLAGGDSRTLRWAFRGSRFGGYHHEFRHANRTSRLLLAALRNVVVPPVSREDQLLIEEVEQLKALPRDERWGRLVELQPRLGDLEARVRSGAFGNFAPPPLDGPVETKTIIGVDGSLVTEVTRQSSAATYTEEQQRELRAGAARHLDMDRQLRRLVGPLSRHPHPVMRSQFACDTASIHLRQAARTS